MVYKSLHTLPIVLFYEILDSGNYNLLTTEKFITQNLEELWEDLKEEYQKLTQGVSYGYLLEISKKASFYLAKYETIQIACNCLLMTKDEKLESILKEWGFDVSTPESIEKLRVKSENLLIKSKIQESKIPKKETNNTKVDIREVLASFVLILGTDLDFETVSVTKFIALEKVIDKKLKANA